MGAKPVENVGFMSAKYQETPPSKYELLYRGLNPNVPKYLGTPEVTIEDRWDLQPFKDLFTKDRNLWPGFATFAQRHLKNPIVKKTRKFEALQSIGGRPFTLRQTIPQGHIYKQPIDLPK